MHRFYLAAGYCQDSVLSLTGREAHHALQVLRVRRREQVQVLDGEGHIYGCEVAESARNRVQLKVFQKRSPAPLPYEITLAQSIPKGKLFEAIIQKATELGVSRMVPLVTQRVVAKLESGDEEHKLEKWNLVAIEAIKQCGSPWLPRIESPQAVAQFSSRQATMDLAMVGSLRADSRHPKEDFHTFERQHGRKPRTISIAIGPEGDFTPEELSMLEAGGGHPITLGPLVLRTETAAVYCLSIINYELQARSSKSDP
jgi:16S rRNA (uracil1498-N3)-methyltransferase